MLHIAVTFRNETEHFQHGEGPLEFGRWPREGVKRIRFKDPAVSRDQLRIEEMVQNHLFVQNLSQRWLITFADGSTLPPGGQGQYPLPVRFCVGKTVVDIVQDKTQEEPAIDLGSFNTISQPVRPTTGEPAQRSLRSLGLLPAPEQLAQWLETVILLQRGTVDSTEFFQEAAQALVDLIGLDLGLVVLRQDSDWEVAAFHKAADSVRMQFSRTLVNHVAQEGHTFFQDVRHWPATESLAGVTAAVASPIFGLQDNVIGVLYGVRSNPGSSARGIRPLEAQVVQLLAAAIGANLARLAAARTRVQFEQFFSPELVRELERNPALLEGRNQEVTVLASDLRGFTSLSERLETQGICRAVNDVLEVLSAKIFDQGGVIVDYAGDGILAMWNAPVPQADHADRACRAALAMLDEVPRLDARWQGVTGSPLSLGIGINTGLAQVGNTGSKRKLKYGPFGHTVNLACRVQTATKTVGVPLLITAATRARLTSSWLTRPVSPLDLAGISEVVTLFEVRGEGSE